MKEINTKAGKIAILTCEECPCTCISKTTRYHDTGKPALICNLIPGIITNSRMIRTDCPLKDYRP